jgi:hypothetical protein
MVTDARRRGPANQDYPIRSHPAVFELTGVAGQPWQGPYGNSVVSPSNGPAYHAFSSARVRSKASSAVL